MFKVTFSGTERLLWKLQAGRSWSDNPVQKRRFFNYQSYWSCREWVKLIWDQNWPQIQPSTVCRPESAWTESWCQTCAAETLKSAPAETNIQLMLEKLEDGVTSVSNRIRWGRHLTLWADAVTTTFSLKLKKFNRWSQISAEVKVGNQLQMWKSHIWRYHLFKPQRGFTKL